MVEGARIDHAAHAADLKGIWKETIEFDHAVKYAVNWAERNGDTLVIVVADHETMGISASDSMNISALKQVLVSPEYMAGELEKMNDKEEFTIDSIKEVFKKYANIRLTDEEIKNFNKQLKFTKGKVYKDKQVSWVIGSTIAAHYHAGTISLPVRTLSSTGGHTGNMVPLFTFGVGAEVFEGVYDNVDIPKVIADLMGYSFD